MGPYSLVDVRVEVEPLISVSAARNVAERLRRAVHRSDHSVSDVLVHVTPYKQLRGTPMRPHTELEREVRAAIMEVPMILGASNIIVHYVPDKGVYLKVNILCDEDITIRRARDIAYE